MEENTCQYCNLQFNKKNSLVRHQELCNKKRVDSYECKICYNIFSDTYSFKNHITECRKNTVNFNSELFESLIQKIDTYKSLYTEQRLLNIKLEKDINTLYTAYQQNITTMNSFLGLDNNNLDINTVELNLEAKADVTDVTNLFSNDTLYKNDIEKFRSTFDYNQTVNDKYQLVDDDNNNIITYKDLDATKVNLTFVFKNKNTLIKLFQDYCDFLQKKIEKYSIDDYNKSFAVQKEHIETVLKVLISNKEIDNLIFNLLRKNFKAAVAEIMLK